MSSRSVQVTLDNHGFVVGGIYTVFISTTVGGVTLYGQYVVATYIDANNFTITATIAASSSTTGYENSDLVRIQYLLPNGMISQGGIAGYGQMPYGIGPYGLGIQENYLPLRQWFFGAWGSDLIAQYTNGAIYVWNPANGYWGNAATVISQSACLQYRNIRRVLSAADHRIRSARRRSLVCKTPCLFVGAMSPIILTGPHRQPIRRVPFAYHTGLGLSAAYKSGCRV